MKYVIYALGAVVLVLGLACHAHVGVGVGLYSPGETAYLDRAMQTSLTFVIPEEKGDEAWTRIKEFVGEHSSMKILSVTDTSLETVRPAKDGEFGYTASRAAGQGSHTITVACVCPPGVSAESEKAREKNAHILARYAMTGEIMPRLIAK